MAKMILYVLGVVLTAVGVLGFFNNPVLGYFDVNMVHNVIHVVTGLVFLWAAALSPAHVRMVAKVFGVVYALVAVLGLVMGEGLLLGLIEVNTADNYLHVLLALVLLYAGFMGKGKSSMSMGMGQSM